MRNLAGTILHFRRSKSTNQDTCCLSLPRIAACDRERMQRRTSSVWSSVSASPGNERSGWRFVPARVLATHRFLVSENWLVFLVPLDSGGCIYRRIQSVHYKTLLCRERSIPAWKLYLLGNLPPFVEEVADVFALLAPVVVYTSSQLG